VTAVHISIPWKLEFCQSEIQIIHTHQIVTTEKVFLQKPEKAGGSAVV